MIILLLLLTILLAIFLNLLLLEGIERSNVKSNKKEEKEKQLFFSMLQTKEGRELLNKYKGVPPWEETDKVFKAYKKEIKC